MKTIIKIIFFLIIIMASVCIGKQGNKSPKLLIKQLEIQGNHFFREGSLKRRMVSRPGWLWQGRYYRSELLQEDMENVKRTYRQYGFLEVNIPSYAVKIDSNKSEVSIALQIDEGERTYIEGIQLFGNQAYSDSLLNVQLKVAVGQPLVARNIDETQNRLLQFYAEAGYLDAQVTVDVKTNPESHRAILDFSIDEQHISRLNNVYLKGVEKTRPKVLFRELKVDSGEVIKYSKLLESQRNLYLTGLFQYAYVRPVPRDSLLINHRDLLVEVQEHQYGEFNLSSGYGSEDKLRIRMEIAHKNLNGTARKLGLKGWLSFIQRGVMLSATDPWLFQQPIKADMNLITEFKEEPGYDFYRSGGQIVLGRRLGLHSDFQMTMRQDFTRFSHVKTLPSEKAKANIRSLKWAITHDTRNNLFNPQNGFYTEVSYELARAFFDDPVLFHRFEGEIKSFYQFRQCVLGTGMEFGWLQSTASIYSIPLNERYYVGGQGSVRGFDYKKIGPLNNDGVPTGGLLKLVWHLAELRFPLYKSMNGAVFCDAGNCWTASKFVRIPDLRSAVGLGLRLNSFLGIIRMDYAWKLDRRLNEKPGAFLFNMGHAF